MYPLSGEIEMRILDVLQKSAILIDLVSDNKVGVLNELVVPVACIAEVDKTSIFNVLMERERLGSTGIGGGIGIPHCKLRSINNIIMGFGLSRKGVEFESIDGELVHVFFLLITPETSAELHLKLLARLSRLLSKEYFKEKLIRIKHSQDLISLIRENDGNDDF